MDRETIRHLLFEYLKTVENTPNTQLSSIYSEVATSAARLGLISAPSGFISGAGYLNPEDLPEQDRLVLQELIWELVVQNIITPGSNWSNPNLPFFRVTNYGARCIQENTILPHDYGAYLQAIRDVTTQTDDIFFLYLGESVDAFNKGLYISSVVNLGVASERLIELLVEVLKDALATEANKTKYEQAIKKAHHIAYQFNEVFSRLVGNKTKLPSDISQDLDMLKALVDIVRRERNDGGHPTGRKFGREETLVLLIAFQPHYKFVIKVLEWLKANPNSL
jgi:hypothetical protein